MYDGLTLEEWRARIQHIRYDQPTAADAVPGLLEIIRDRDVPWYTRRQAALTLGRIGEPAQRAVPVLVEFLNEPVDDGAVSTHLWSIKALALFGGIASEATPVLIEILRSDSRSHLCRLSTLEALGRIGTAHPQTLPAIIEVLESGPAADGTSAEERLERRIAAAEVLDLYGGHAALAVPALIAASADESVQLRRAAVYTLGTIGPAADPAVSALVDRMLFDESEEVRDLAATALAGIGTAAEPYLRQLLQDSDVEIRWRAADVLGELGSVDEVTQDVLQDALSDESTLVRLLAAGALWSANEDAALVIPTIIAELGHPDREMRMQAVPAS